MANEDIGNCSGGYTGVQKLGRVTVATGASIPKQSTTHASGTTPIADLTGIYQNRFDDPTYY